ncbi:MgtC/SapB family protein [Ramlibacter sp. G-1-2-2]|uniref:Protein MgtC n=1 Tax=Ramlibacter agri TaxID=2728837 RepID=A0A848H9B7_9BURK|nr:MgtC/SapB family protein [Ramlibacter agri]NML47365.1 MgtC/SapB family protein [Ramlibacter agri]
MGWETVTGTIAAEFSDLGDAEQLTRTLLRLAVAVVLGGCIGFQRERHGHEAGTRTHMLVCAGSALFVLLPQQLQMSDDAVSRVLQGLLAGIGFLCAGAILKRPQEEHVRGLTTSAGIWMTAAIGTAAGLGREGTAVVSALLLLFVLALEKPLKRVLGPRGHRRISRRPERPKQPGSADPTDRANF